MNILNADTSRRRVSHMFFYFRFEQGQLTEGRCWVVFRLLLIRFAIGTWSPVSITAGEAAAAASCRFLRWSVFWSSYQKIY